MPKQWYSLFICTIRKTGGSEGDICFSGADNEQMPDEIGHSARSVCLRVCDKLRKGNFKWRRILK